MIEVVEFEFILERKSELISFSLIGSLYLMNSYVLSVIAEWETTDKLLLNTIQVGFVAVTDLWE